MATGWFKFPGEDYQGNPIVAIEWEGPGWYCTTRTFPGSEVYKTWNTHEDLSDQLDRDAAARSYGGSIRYYSEQPEKE